MAIGIAHTGSGFGQFALAPIFTLLLNAYGWKITMLFVAGLTLTCVIFGALIRPLKPKYKIEIRDTTNKVKNSIGNTKANQILCLDNEPVCQLTNSNEGMSNWHDFRYLLFPSLRYVQNFHTVR